MNRFIADAMLGKLALWMRVIGCDVLYFPNISDDRISQLADSDNRILLTRDTRLIRRVINRNRSFLVIGDHYPDQFRQVVQAFDIDPARYLLSRCLRCNELLVVTEKTGLKDRIPPYVFETLDHFKTCPHCGKIYWKATHVDRMIQKLEQMLSHDSPGAG
jgi:hypothetical protein